MTGARKIGIALSLVMVSSFFVLAGADSCGSPPSLLAVHNIHPDHLGSAPLLTDASGVFERTTFTPFGEIDTRTGSRGAGLPTHAYTDHEYDPESGLYYMRARYYDPVVGRFLSPDPALNDGGESFNRIANFPAHLNAYSYVNNRPTVAVDPTGRAPAFVVLGIVWIYQNVGYIAVGTTVAGGGLAYASGGTAYDVVGDPAQRSFGIAAGAGRAARRGSSAVVRGGTKGVEKLRGVWASRSGPPSSGPSSTPPKTVSDVIDFDDLDVGEFRFRIVPKGHARYDDALRGVAKPFDETPIGDPLTAGDLDWRFRAYQANEHTLPTDLTAWFDRPITQRALFQSISEGVILRIPRTSGGPGWRVVPDTFGFHEGAKGGLPVWIQGTVPDAEVIPFRNFLGGK